MAIYKNGISGGFSGKIGAVVGSTWKGIDYMRSLPRKSNRPPTEAQKAQRLKLSMAISFLSPVSDLVNTGFTSDAVKKSGFNVATSHIIQQAIEGQYPDFTINFSRVLISSGNLTGAWNTSTQSDTPGSLTVSWTDNSGAGSATSSDQAVILVYDAGLKKCVYTMGGAGRNLGSHTLHLPSEFSGATVDVWIAFRSADTKSISTSIYAGQVKIA